MAEKQFLVSVADAYLFNPVTKALVIKGKALLNSSLEQTVQSNDVWAGRGSVKQFQYKYQKALNVTIESADFSPAYLALQTGSTIKNELSKYYMEETLTFDGTGKATVTETPVGDVYVELASGSNQSVTPSTKDITVVGLANSTVKVVYQYNTTVDVIDIPANTFPSALELVLSSDIYGSGGAKTYEMQIQVPKYLLNGAITLDLKHDGTSNTSLTGTALADTGNNYAYVKFKPVATATVAIDALAATPSAVQLSKAATPADTEQLSVIGIRSGVYSNVVMDNSTLTFTSDTSTIATVNSSGLITIAGTAVVGDHTVIRISDGTHTDVVAVDIIA